MQIFASSVATDANRFVSLADAMDATNAVIAIIVAIAIIAVHAIASAKNVLIVSEAALKHAVSVLEPAVKASSAVIVDVSRAFYLL